MGLRDIVSQALIRPYELADVTSTEGGEPEVDPRSVGLSRKSVARIWRAVEDAYRSRLFPAISITLRRRGEVVLDRAIGHVRGNAPIDPPDAPVVQATPKTLFNLFSASKMVTAMLIHLLDERGLVSIEQPVASYVPEFAQNGKQAITVRHVLSHRAGIPFIPAEYANLDSPSRPALIFDVLCKAKPAMEPGKRLAYHALTGGYVLAAIIERVTGRDVHTFLADEILRPLNFSHFNYGVPPEDFDKVAIHAFTGSRPIQPVSGWLKRLLGVEFIDAVRMSNDPRYMGGVIPAGNVIGTANEASRFMELLLRRGQLDGVRVFDPSTISRAVSEQAYMELDWTLIAPIRQSMGFNLGSRYASMFGVPTPRLFGHLGFTAVYTYADPERDISLGLMTSGKPVVAPGALSIFKLLQTIAYSCPRDWGQGE